MVLGVERGWEVRGRDRTRIEFAKEQRFQFGVRVVPWRDGKGRGLSELVGWVRYLSSQYWREFLPKRGDSYGNGALGKFK